MAPFGSSLSSHYVVTHIYTDFPVKSFGRSILLLLLLLPCVGAAVGFLTLDTHKWPAGRRSGVRQLSTASAPCRRRRFTFTPRTRRAAPDSRVPSAPSSATAVKRILQSANPLWSEVRNNHKNLHRILRRSADNTPIGSVGPSRTDNLSLAAKIEHLTYK